MWSYIGSRWTRAPSPTCDYEIFEQLLVLGTVHKLDYKGKVPKTGWGGSTLFCLTFCRPWVPHFRLHIGTPFFWWPSLVPPPFQMNFCAPPIFFFQKCICGSQHFFIAQKGIILIILIGHLIFSLNSHYLDANQLNFIGKIFKTHFPAFQLNL